MTVTPDMVIATLDTKIGWQYGFNDRCGGSYHQFDCSGYQCWMMNQLGIGIGCISSFVIAQLCYDHGLMIGEEEARRTKAVWAFHGPHGGRGPSRRSMGADGHIICGAGDGTTREAMGRRYGVVVGHWDGRGWVSYAKIPGVNYAPPRTKEQDMLIQFHDGHNKTKIAVPAGRTMVVGLSADGTYIEEWNGASVWGDQHYPGDPSNKRRWYPKAGNGHPFLAPGRKYIGIARHKDDSGIVAVVDDGGTVDVRWS